MSADIGCGQCENGRIFAVKARRGAGTCNLYGKEAVAFRMNYRKDVIWDGMTPCKCVTGDPDAFKHHLYVKDDNGRVVDDSLLIHYEQVGRRKRDLEIPGPVERAIKTGMIPKIRERSPVEQMTAMDIFDRVSEISIKRSERAGPKHLMIVGETGTCKTMFANKLYNDDVRFGDAKRKRIKLTEFEFLEHAAGADLRDWAAYLNKILESDFIILDNWFSAGVEKTDLGTSLQAPRAGLRYQEFHDWIDRGSLPDKFVIITTRTGPEFLKRRGDDWEDMVRRVNRQFAELPT